MTLKTKIVKSGDEKALVFRTGKWGEEQQGVKFLSFEMPMRDDERITFAFSSPEESEGTVDVSNVQELMGVILLFKPKNEHDKNNQVADTSGEEVVA